MEPINTRDPATAARAYLRLEWPLALGHRYRPRQGCTCTNATCPAPGAHPLLDSPPRRLTEDTAHDVLQTAPGVSLITATTHFDAVLVPHNIAMAALVRLDRVSPVPCLVYGDTAALLVLPATGRYALVHPDAEARTGPDGWVALPPSQGVRWDTPPWNEQTGEPHPLLNGADVGRHLAEAFKLSGQRTPVDQAPVDVEEIRRTCESVLWAWRYPTGEEGEHLAELLRGHVQLLVPEVTERARGMRGEQQKTAEYVLARTRRMLARGAVTPQEEVLPYVWDLATQCRALLVLYQSASPLDAPADSDDASELRS